MRTTCTQSMAALLILASLTFGSCSKKSEVIGIALPNTVNFKNIRAKALQDIIQKKTFKAEDGLTYVSPKGTEVIIPANCLRNQNGELVNGDVDLQFAEMYDKGSMVATNKPLMGKNAAGAMLPLVTGGQYNIEVKQGNNTLRPGCTFNVHVKASNTGELDPLMTLWEGNLDENGDLQWEAIRRENQKEAGLRVNEQNGTYNVWSSTFGWANVDRFYNDTRPKTKIKVTVPSGYTNQNAGVYLSYVGEPNVLAQLDTYDAGEKYFSEHYGFVPIGMTLHVIFVSESNGSAVYAVKTATIVENGVITFEQSDLSTGTIEQVINRINALH